MNYNSYFHIKKTVHLQQLKAQKSSVLKKTYLVPRVGERTWERGCVLNSVCERGTMHLSSEGILEGYRLNLRAGNNFSHIATYDSDLQVTRGCGGMGV